MASNREGPPLRVVRRQLMDAGAVLVRTTSHAVWRLPSGVSVAIPVHGRHVSRNVYASVRRALNGLPNKTAGMEASA